MKEAGDNGVFYDGEQALRSALSRSGLHLSVLEAGTLSEQELLIACRGKEHSTTGVTRMGPCPNK